MGTYRDEEGLEVVFRGIQRKRWGFLVVYRLPGSNTDCVMDRDTFYRRFKRTQEVSSER